MAARTGKASGRSALGGVMFLLVSVAVFAPAADAFKERDVIDSVMATIRNRAANQGYEQPNTLDELAELGSNLLKAFGPLIQTDGTQNQLPAVKLLNFEEAEAEGVEEGDRRGLLENLPGHYVMGRFINRATNEARHVINTAWNKYNSSGLRSAVQRLFRKTIEEWPIKVQGIWMNRGSGLGGGTCSFSFESRKNIKYLPLIWKMTDAECRSFEKRQPSAIVAGPASNRYCVDFKLFGKVDFTHCAPSAYWQALVKGEAIYVNPSNGATVIDFVTMVMTGGLDQFLPLRAELGQGGLLDILNYL